MALISIITPTRNRPELLKRCIRAIQHQEFKDYEHIIVSDGCSLTESVVREFNDEHIKFYYMKRDFNSCSGALARNFGIKQATSNFIVYCDDDNILLPNHCLVHYNELKKEEYECVFSREYVILNESYKNVFKRELFDYSGYSHIIPKDIWYDTMMIGHTKSFIEKYGGWMVTDKKDDDGPMINKWIEDNAPIKLVDDITSIYFNYGVRV